MQPKLEQICINMPASYRAFRLKCGDLFRRLRVLRQTRRGIAFNAVIHEEIVHMPFDDVTRLVLPKVFRLP